MIRDSSGSSVLAKRKQDIILARDSQRDKLIDAIRDKDRLPIFRNQVGGHKPILWCSLGTILKPLTPDELSFYCTVHNELPRFLPFIPRFFGVKELDGHLTPSPSAPNTPRSASSPTPLSSSQPVPSSIPLLTDAKVSFPNARRSTSDISESSQSSQVKYNKWGWKTAQNLGDNPKPQKYLVLEDLTFSYERPNILDLKIGTRQHGADESAEKVKSKQDKCRNTTSSSLGLRLMGNQMFRPDRNEYEFRDKFFGRALSDHTFLCALWEFFHDGNEIVVDAVESCIERVEELAHTLAHDPATRCYRFWSSSVLLVFEGAPPRTSSSGSQSTQSPSVGEHRSSNSDAGLVDEGDQDRELSQCLGNTDSDEETHHSSLSQSPPFDDEDAENAPLPDVDHDQDEPNDTGSPLTVIASSTGVPMLIPGASESLQSAASAPLVQSGYGARRVDIRVIDFAHTTKTHSPPTPSGVAAPPAPAAPVLPGCAKHENSPVSVLAKNDDVPGGPDEGMLLGLRTLQRILRWLLEHACKPLAEQRAAEVSMNLHIQSALTAGRVAATKAQQKLELERQQAQENLLSQARSRSLSSDDAVLDSPQVESFPPPSPLSSPSSSASPPSSLSASLPSTH